TGNPDPAPIIPVPATSRPVPGMGSAGPPWGCLGSWRRHWRTARRRTTRRRTARRRTAGRRTARRWRHGLPMGDNGESDDCERRQDFSSMYHGILLVVPPVVATVPHVKGARSGFKRALRDFSIHYMSIRYRKLISDGLQPRGVAAK